MDPEPWFVWLHCILSSNIEILGLGVDLTGRFSNFQILGLCAVSDRRAGPCAVDSAVIAKLDLVPISIVGGNRGVDMGIEVARSQ